MASAPAGASPLAQVPLQRRWAVEGQGEVHQHPREVCKFDALDRVVGLCLDGVR